MATAANAVYDELKARNYNDCELSGVTYLDADERATPQFGYPPAGQVQLIKTFIDKVKAYTGKAQVDIVAHSMGSSMALAMPRYSGNQASVRRFINTGGGLRGFNTCYATGSQSAYAPTCNAEAYVWPYDRYTFVARPAITGHRARGGSGAPGCNGRRLRVASHGSGRAVAPVRPGRHRASSYTAAGAQPRAPWPQSRCALLRAAAAAASSTRV